MPWNNQGDKNKNPWGNGDSGNRGGGQTPPNLEDIIRQGQDKFRKMMPGGGNFSGKIGLVLAAIAVLWLSSGVYRVNEGEQGVILRFGAYVYSTGPGLHYHFPYPIEQDIVRRVDRINRIDSDREPVQFALAAGFRKSEDQPLMLTGDENIVDVTYTVHWYINSLEKYLFSSPNPDKTVQEAAESIIREIMARTTLSDALTKSRGAINDEARKELQRLLNEYDLGITIDSVLLRKVDPPAKVIDSFRDVQRARTDQERFVNEARAYANALSQTAQGEAVKHLEEAKAYRAAVVSDAEGQAQSFNLVYDKYRLNPTVIKRRMHLEALESILQNAQKVIMPGDGQGILPHMALPALQVKLPAKGTDEGEKE
jgi:membrane protease subunit HflK